MSKVFEANALKGKSLAAGMKKKLQAANEQLYSVKDRADKYRKIIKTNYQQEEWERFGLLDKR